MAEREGHDPLLEVGADRVRHSRPPALADPERLDPQRSTRRLSR
jgi:hypothetical protein